MPRTLILGVILLALASALALVIVPRWVPLSDVVLADPGFATLGQPGSPWRLVGEGTIQRLDDGVRIMNVERGTTVGIDQSMHRPAAATAYRITATVALEDVVNGTERWERARILVQSEAPDVRFYFHGPNQLVDREGTTGPRRLTDDFPVSPDHDTARLMIRLQHATGALEVRDLEVTALEKPLARVILRQVLIVVWLLAGSGVAAVLWWQSHNRLAAGFVVVVVAAALLIVVFPDDIRSPIHHFLRELAGDERLLLLKPLAHILAFGALALASRLALPGWPIWVVAPAWLSAAVLLELGELRYGHFEPDDWGDMAFNASGAMLGLLIARLRQMAAGRRTAEAASGAPDRAVSRTP